MESTGEDSSDEESSEIQQNNLSESTSESASSGPRVGGGLSTDTDSEEDVMEKQENSTEETAVTEVSSRSQAAELEPKKVCTILPVSLLYSLLGCKAVRTRVQRENSHILPHSFGKFPCRVEIVEIVSEYYRTDTPPLLQHSNRPNTKLPLLSFLQCKLVKVSACD